MFLFLRSLKVWGRYIYIYIYTYVFRSQHPRHRTYQSATKNRNKHVELRKNGFTPHTHPPIHTSSSMRAFVACAAICLAASRFSSSPRVSFIAANVSKKRRPSTVYRPSNTASRLSVCESVASRRRRYQGLPTSSVMLVRVLDVVGIKGCRCRRQYGLAMPSVIRVAGAVGNKGFQHIEGRCRQTDPCWPSFNKKS